MTAPNGLTVRVWRIDFKTAQKFLSFEKQPQKGVDGTNRKFSAGLVNEYAFEMLAGRWLFTHEGMAFIGHMADGDADFKDGGQRCRAIIQAATKGATVGDKTYPPNPDVAIDVMVTEGLDEASWLAMNIGKRRTPADFLVMSGYVSTNALASAIQICCLYEKEPQGVPYVRERWYKDKMSPTQRREFLEANPGLPAALREGARIYKVMTLGAATAAYHLAIKAGADQGVLDTFMEGIASGVVPGNSVSRNHPILRLRDVLINARVSRRKLSREEQLALFIKAFNAFVMGYEIKVLSFRSKKARTGASPEAFPRFQV